MNRTLRKNEQGAAVGSIIAISLLGLGLVVLAGLSIWLYLQYSEQKSHVDSKIKVAVAEAQRSQSEADDKKFVQREKEPNRDFVGPNDYGRVSFKYPKTWSVYIDQDASKGGTFSAYFNPVKVPHVSNLQRYALRVVIENTDYASVVKSYENKIKTGDLKIRTTSSNGESGTRLDGSFTNDIRGAVVIYKVRDKTLSIFTDANTFKPDFENIIKTIKYNA